jgi:hypothetical protein
MKKIAIFVILLLFASSGLAQSTNAYGLKLNLPSGWKVVDNSEKSWSFISARHPQKNASIYIESFTGDDGQIAQKINSFVSSQAKLAGVSPSKINEDFIIQNRKIVKKPEKGLNFFVFEITGEAVNDEGEKGWTLVYVTMLGDKAIFFGAVERYKDAPAFNNTIRKAFESIAK